MASISGYTFLLSAEAFHYCQTQRLMDRRDLGDAFWFFADHPFLDGDYQEQDQNGRTIQVLLKGRFRFTFWTDHATKEVRIVRVESA